MVSSHAVTIHAPSTRHDAPIPPCRTLFFFPFCVLPVCCESCADTDCWGPCAAGIKLSRENIAESGERAKPPRACSCGSATPPDSGSLR